MASCPPGTAVSWWSSASRREEQRASPSGDRCSQAEAVARERLHGTTVRLSVRIGCRTRISAPVIACGETQVSCARLCATVSGARRRNPAWAQHFTRMTWLDRTQENRLSSWQRVAAASVGMDGHGQPRTMTRSHCRSWSCRAARIALVITCGVALFATELVQASPADRGVRWMPYVRDLGLFEGVVDGPDGAAWVRTQRGFGRATPSLQFTRFRAPRGYPDTWSSAGDSRRGPVTACSGRPTGWISLG